MGFWHYRVWVEEDDDLRFQLQFFIFYFQFHLLVFQLQFSIFHFQIHFFVYLWLNEEEEDIEYIYLSLIIIMFKHNKESINIHQIKDSRKSHTRKKIELNTEEFT